MGRLKQIGDQQGMGMVLSSHQMEDVADLAADITAFRKGTSVFDGPAGKVFWQFDDLHEIGLEAPVAAQTAARLRELGWPVAEGLVTADQLENALVACVEPLP